MDPFYQENAFFDTTRGGRGAPAFASPLLGSLGLSAVTGVGGGASTGILPSALNQLSQLTALDRLSGLTGLLATRGQQQLASGPDISDWGAMVEVRTSVTL